MAEFQARKQELDKKEIHFKNSVLKFNNFLKVFKEIIFLNIFSFVLSALL
jgi:hypothetical protein